MATKTIEPEALQSLARLFADYRLGGCPSGGAAALQATVKKAARSHGMNFSELWSEVHRLGSEILTSTGPTGAPSRNC